jgi:hypothetical protein
MLSSAVVVVVVEVEVVEVEVRHPPRSIRRIQG